MVNVYVKKLFFMMFVFSFAVNAQIWQKVTSATYNDLNASFFIDENNGWLVGKSGGIYFTSDGGNSSIPQTSNTTKNLLTVHFTDASNGYAAGEGLSFLKTADGGFNWDSVYVDTTIFTDTKANITAIHFINDSTGWILAGSSKGGWIAYTENSGETWQTQLSISNILYDFSFSDNLHGVAVGKDEQTLYYTENGVNWIKATPPDLSAGGYSAAQKQIRTVTAVNNDLIYAAGYGLNHPDPTKSKTTIFLRSTDGGKNWNYLQQSDDNKIYEIANDIYFKDDLNGLVLTNNLILKTSDGGENWIKIDQTIPASTKGISGLDDKIWITGSDGLLAFSNNFLQSFSIQSQVLNFSINKIKVVNNSKIFAGGYRSTILESNNNGLNWENRYLITNNKGYDINDVQFINENIVYAAQSYGLLSKSTDGGINWYSVIPEAATSALKNNGLHFFDENNGFVVGKLGSTIDVIYRIKDGVFNSDTTLNTVNKELFDISFADENVGIAVGATMSIARTEDGGDTWKKVQLDSMFADKGRTLSSIAIHKDKSMFVLGTGILLKSIDLGKTWNPVVVDSIFSKATLNEMSFFNDSIGVITGYVRIDTGGFDDGVYYGKVFLSRDYGNTWEDFSDGQYFRGMRLNSVDISDSGKIWLAGMNGTIYSHQLQLPVSVASNRNLISTFALEQNYPNPFNPSTNIQYSIPENGIVTLKVYDILGRLIHNLVDEYQTAGSYKVNFNAGNLASGIYIYSLNYNGKVFTKKMQLLK